MADIFSRFWVKAKPLLDGFLKNNYKKIPIEIQTEIDNLIGKIILKCCEVYKKDILKEKYDLDVDLSSMPQPSTSEAPSERFIKKFCPCEVCAETRVIQLCHIIPRKEGGEDNPGNVISLCANHHYLFDRHRLLEGEWNVINWERKDIHVRKYALAVRYSKHGMYWKYNYSGMIGCQCGSQDFAIYYTEQPPKVREGGIEEFPGVLEKHLKCRVCGEHYSQMTFKNIEYRWWQYYIKTKDQLK